VFQTTFASALCPDWSTPNGQNDNNVCQTGDGIAGHGGWSTSNGSWDQITSVANYSGGGGGKGFRHYRGDGVNNNGGGLFITLPSGLSEMWVRWYMRYSSGFAWANPGNPEYIKDHYWFGTDGSIFFGAYGDTGAPNFYRSWGMIHDRSPTYGSATGWVPTMGGNTGDGLYHCYEYHVKANGAASVIEIWVDGVRYLSKTDANIGSGTFTGFILGSNQRVVTGAGGTDYYTDYDDIAISNSGRIGCIGSIVVQAPKNLRVQ